MVVTGFLFISRCIAISILLSWVLLVSKVALGQQYQPSDEKVQTLSQEIKNTAQEVMHASWLDVSKPHIFIEGRKARFYGGGASNLGFEEGDPWEIIYRWQIDFEIYRQFLRKNPRTMFIWERNRMIGEKLILQGIRDILSGKQKIDENQFDLQFEDKIEEDMHRYLQKRGYKIYFSESGNGAIPLPFAKIITEPQGGKVSVLPYLEYKKSMMLGKNLDEMPWRNLLGDDELLMGKYFYRVTWPTGGKDSGSVIVTKNTTLTFRPTDK